MENPTPIEKLDIVLSFLKSQNMYLMRSEIMTGLKHSGLDIAEYDLVILMDKLINDGYLIETSSDQRNNPIEHRFLISYYGRLFDGYVKKKEIDDQIKIIADKKERAYIRNNEQLVIATWFAGFAALFLLVWQIVQYFMEHSCNLKS